MSILCGTTIRWLGRDTKLFLPLISVRHKARDPLRHMDLPSNSDPNSGRFRRIVHYPEEYTVKPLDVTNLAGRDPVTGRVVVKGIGGGIKRKYHWIDWIRQRPVVGDTVLEEKVIEIIKDWCRTSLIALVASGDRMRYILATMNMKAGDTIRTSTVIPRIPVLAKEGDAHPLGALPNGTQVHCIEKYPGIGGFLVHSAGTAATILRRADERVILQLPSKREISLVQECMATVGRLSNVEHNKTPIGSAQRNRELGNRPRSGLWHRKTGRHGRVIRPPRPVLVVDSNRAELPEQLQLTLGMDMFFGHRLSDPRVV